MAVQLKMSAAGRRWTGRADSRHYNIQAFTQCLLELLLSSISLFLLDAYSCFPAALHYNRGAIFSLHKTFAAGSVVIVSNYDRLFFHLW